MGLGSQGRITVQKAAIYAQSDGLMYTLTKSEIKSCMSLALPLCKYHGCSHKDCSRK